jgi:hypothetical protein
MVARLRRHDCARELDFEQFVCVPVADKSNADCAQILHTYSGCVENKIPFRERVFLLVVSA